MARILISFSSHIFDEGDYKLAVFYDGFLNALIRCGNEVMAINSADYLLRSWHGDNQVNGLIDKNKLVKGVQDFAPQLIIAFNHSIPSVILDETDCPVAVWDADSIQFFNETDYIKKNLERYHFLCFSQAGVDNALKFGAHNNKVHFVLAGTDIQAENIPVDKNISFIGTNFTVPDAFIRALKDHSPEKVKPIVEALNRNFYDDQDAIIKAYNAEWMLDYMASKNIAGLSAVQKRITILNNAQELGLALYGGQDWYHVGNYLPWLAMSYNPQKVYSLKHNQDIYNSSKLCLNISHSQATDGFSWRVMDIMASNGCLISDHKSGLADFTKGYVDIPMYESAAEADDLCPKLLKDEKWRREIVEGSQLCIAEKGRWRQRFEILSEIFGIDLTPTKQEPATRPDNEKVLLPVEEYEAKWAPSLRNLIDIFIIIFPTPVLILLYKFMQKVGFRIPYKFVLKAHALKKRGGLNRVYEIYRGFLLRQ